MNIHVGKNIVGVHYLLLTNAHSQQVSICSELYYVYAYYEETETAGIFILMMGMILFNLSSLCSCHSFYISGHKHLHHMAAIFGLLYLDK